VKLWLHTAQAFYHPLVGQQLFVMVTVSVLQIFFCSQARASLPLGAVLVGGFELRYPDDYQCNGIDRHRTDDVYYNPGYIDLSR
jgi:hypothetical protein